MSELAGGAACSGESLADGCFRNTVRDGEFGDAVAGPNMIHEEFSVSHAKCAEDVVKDVGVVIGGMVEIFFDFSVFERGGGEAFPSLGLAEFGTVGVSSDVEQEYKQ